MKYSRRKFVAAGIAGAATIVAPSILGCRKTHRFSGGIVGGNSGLGHLLRERRLPAPTDSSETQVVIVGGGIAGLAAARRLQQQGIKDIVLLELERETGGNSASGVNSVSAYPWAAHYVPLPGTELTEIVRLFEELGVITGRTSSGLPVYREEFLCADPMERLFIHGRWQEGLVPNTGLSPRDRSQLEEFFARMNEWKRARGRDGRRAFNIPVDESSRDAELLSLDQITMADYLRSQGWDAEPLRWYVDYCCRDDYGAGLEQISAWAGIHYFASRGGEAANAPGHAVLTWPEGNGWIAQRLRTPIASNIRSSCLVWNVEPQSDLVAVDYFDASAQRSARLVARAAVFAAPRFVAQRVLRAGREHAPALNDLSYSPWMVANLTLDSLPQGDGAALAWDNVFYGSRSLGYVTATHQHLHPFPKRTVLTYYLPLDDAEPRMARTEALARRYEDWCELILADLSKAHHAIAKQLSHLDVWLWGHGMIRPVPGFIWGESRRRMREPSGNVFFAHSDMSGISIFEEAYTRGIQAAEQVVQRLARAPA